MRLNFATLADPIQRMRGQVGTAGTVSIHGLARRPQLDGNAGDKRGQFAPALIGSTIECRQVSPMSPGAQTIGGQRKSSIHAVVPNVPNVPRVPTQSAENDGKAVERPAPKAYEMVERACVDCEHFARPGLSDGYCGGRDDLPPAYGANHPLRELPGDGGASCDQWQASIR